MPRGQKRTRQEIVAGIKNAWDAGLDLRTGAVCHGNHPLRWAYRSYDYYFPSWRATLVAAGLTYEEVDQRARAPKKEKKKQDLLAEIQRAHKAGIALNAGALQNSKDRKHRALYERAKTVFRNEGRLFWEKVLEAADLPVAQIVKERAWTQQLVVQRLKARHQSGKPINVTAVKGDQCSLYKAAIIHFESYDHALKAAGFRSTSVRKRKKSLTNQEIVREIIAYHLRGWSLNATNIRNGRAKKIKRVYYVTCRRFPGGWPEAVQTAGIDYDQYRKRQPHGYWSRARVFEWIERLDQQGSALDLRSVRKKHSALVRATWRYADGWYSALESCGKDANAIRLLHVGFSREQLIAEIQSRARVDRDLSVTGMLESEELTVRRIYLQAVERFGSWKTAVSAAGLNYLELSRRHPRYTVVEMIRCIRQLADQGINLNPYNEDSFPNGSEQKNVYRAVIRRFDSWYDFLVFAKVDLSLYQARVDWQNGKQVIAYLQERFDTGVVTGASVDRNFAAAVRQYFGKMEKAVQVAGMVYCPRGSLSQQQLADSEVMGILYRFNQQFLRRIADKVYYIARGQGFRSLDQGDLVQEAFLKFMELLPQKPRSKGIRQFTYWPIRKYLLEMNKQAFPEIVYGEEIYLDIFSIDDSPWA